MPNVIELIEKDHREVEALFAKFESTHEAAIATQICDELDRHATGEEKAVYPVIASDVPGGAKLIEEAEGEHKEARQLIGRIRQTSEAQHLTELMTELKQAIEHHVREEESEVLPQTQRSLDAAQLNRLGDEFQTAKR